MNCRRSWNQAACVMARWPAQVRDGPMTHREAHLWILVMVVVAVMWPEIVAGILLAVWAMTGAWQ